MGGGDGTAGRPLSRARLVRWAHLVAERLEAARAELDALNVFPVADGDTGTNLSLTVSRALAAAGDVDGVARAMLVQARGSSGVIASQLVRGWTEVLLATGPDGRRPLDAVGGVPPGTVAAALARGDELAWQAVGAPVEGTVLSVSRAAAAAAGGAAAAGASTADVVAAAVAAGREALGRTPVELPVLAAAGVVDSGGSALVLALEALADVLADEAAADVPARAGARPGATRAVAHGVGGLDLGPGGPAYEVMYLLEGEPDAGDRLRDALAAVGDSVVVVGGGGLWHAHVHTDDPGAAVERGLSIGRPHDIRITHFLAAAAARADTVPAGTVPAPVEPSAPEPPPPPRPSLTVVACVDGEATAALCRDAGALVTAPHTLGDVLGEALAEADTGGGTAPLGRRVLVLADSQDAAEAVRALARPHVRPHVVVAPAGSPVQVVAALRALGLSAGAAPDDLADQACAAAAACRRLDVDGVDPDAALLAVTRWLATGAVGTADLVTLVPGRGGTGLADAVAAGLRARHPLLTVQVLGGGQAAPRLQVGAE